VSHLLGRMCTNPGSYYQSVLRLLSRSSVTSSQESLIDKFQRKEGSSQSFVQTPYKQFRNEMFVKESEAKRAFLKLEAPQSLVTCCILFCAAEANDWSVGPWAANGVWRQRARLRMDRTRENSLARTPVRPESELRIP
jgi:hypothetical protein